MQLFNPFHNYDQIKIEKQIRLIELFAGVGSQAMALRDIGVKFESYRVCEFDRFAIQSYNAIHGTSFPVSDIRDWKGDDLGIVDKDKYEYIMTYSFPCFTGDTKVITDADIKDIKDIQVGDRVLTHDGTYQKVLWSGKTGRKKIYRIKTDLNQVIRCTENHLLYVRECEYIPMDDFDECFIMYGEVKFMSVGDLYKDSNYMCNIGSKNYHIGIPIDRNTLPYLGDHIDLDHTTKKIYWYEIKDIIETDEVEDVYDITVENNHTFVADGMIVHNCTDISTAGKQMGMSKDSGTRSGLLWEVERLLKETKELPQILLMENVTQVHSDKFIKDFNNWCDFLKSLGYTNKWADLEATDYGVAQTRNRCFMVSVLGKINYDFPKPIPLDKVLIDYLEPYVDKKYYVTTDFAKKLVKDIVEQNRLVLRDTITPQVDSVRWIRTEEGKKLRKDYEAGKIHHGFNEYRVIEQRSDSLSGTVTTVTKDNIVLEVDKIGTDITHMVGRDPDNPSDRHSDNYEQRLEVKETDGCGTITTVTKDNICLEKYVIENMDFNERGTVHNEFGICRTITGSGGSGGYHSGNQPKVLQVYKSTDEDRYIVAHPYHVYDRKFIDAEKMSTLGTNCDHYNTPVASQPVEIIENSIFEYPELDDFIYNIDGKKYLVLIRKLTPLECWRLMGFTDEDFIKAKDAGVSNSQLYKQAGNSIVKQVLMAIFKNMNIRQ